MELLIKMVAIGIIIVSTFNYRDSARFRKQRGWDALDSGATKALISG